jgi:tricorn protease
MRTLLTTALLITLFLSTAIASENNLQWLRHSAISPDGQFVAFTYHGDIWKVPVDGGKAVRMTVHAAYDAAPVWSNDGKQIAFSYNRYGNFDVFIMNATGGELKRLTYHSGDDWPSGFTQNDRSVLFSAVRTDVLKSMLHPDFGELYSVDIDGGRPEMIFSIPVKNARQNKNGDILFEEIKGYEDQWRKHHTSSVTRDIWLWKASDSTFHKLSTFEGENRNPVFTSENGYYYLSEADGNFDVYRSNLSDNENMVQITDFSPHPVRYLSVADNGTLAFSYNGAIYVKKPNEEAKELVIDLSGDQNILPREPLMVNSDISEMVVSPNGKEIVFIYRGEVFASTIEGTLTRQLTQTPEQERTLDISPDGKKIVYAGERDNSWNLYTMELGKDDQFFVNAIDLKEKILLQTDKETFQPKFSPDGKEVAFLEERIILKKINAESGTVTQIHDGQQNFSYADGDQHFEWSPDGKWFSITFYPTAHWVSEMGIIKSDGSGEIINLTKSGFYDESPQWSPDGQMIYWMSDRHGAHSVAKTGSFELDVYGLFLTQKALDEFKMDKAEAALMEKKEDEEKDDDKEKDEDKEDEVVLIDPIEMEFEGLRDRKERLTLFSSYISDVKLDKKSENLYILGRTDKKYTLWKIDLRTKETKSLASFDKSGSLQFDNDYSHLFVLSDGKISSIDVKSEESESVSVNGEMVLDYSAERQYLMDHVARQVKKKFLDPELHGADWDSLVLNYRRFVADLNNDFDFRDVLGELLGELNASHTGARWREKASKGDQTASLGAHYDRGFNGNGLKILEVFMGSPLKTGSDKIHAGIVIESIDNKQIVAGQNYFPLLNRKVGKQVLVGFYNPAKGERWKEWIKPISLSEESELLYQRWIKRNRDYVHELSGDQIGYMHVRNMSDRSFREFLEEAMGEEINKKALIVDTRSNGGGDLVDDLTTWLSGTKYMEFESNDGRTIGIESQRRWTKPSVMLIGEDNYSDAHCTPAAYKDLEIGQLIGMPVPGTCSFVWWERLQNGMVFGIPNMWVKDIGGEVLENNQLEPDIKVKNGFKKIVDGQDEQIVAAVMFLLEECK